MSDPTTGGVFASYAAMGDVNLAEPNALIGFAGARVGAGTIGQELPPGFQRSEFLFRHGFVDRVVARAGPPARARPDPPLPRPASTLEADRWLTGILGRGREAARGRPEAAEPRRAEPPLDPQGRGLGARPAGPQPPPPAHARAARRHGRRVRRAPRRPACSATTRRSWPGSRPIDGHRVAVVGQQKGADTEENVRRNFGMPHPEGYRKAMRIMELAERVGLPVVTFVDVPGAHPGPESEERGIAEAIARSVGPDDPPPDADRHRDHRRGRLRRRARDRRRRRRARARERRLLRDLARGLREHPVADHRRGADRGPRDADERPGPARAGRRRRGDPRAAPRAPTPTPRRRAGGSRPRSSASWTGWRRSRSTCWSSSAIAGTVRSARTTRSPRPPPRPTVPPRPGLADRLRNLIEAGQRAIPAPLPVGRRQEPPAREDV